MGVHGPRGDQRRRRVSHSAPHSHTSPAAPVSPVTAHEPAFGASGCGGFGASVGASFDVTF
jgi:hypothetical protein